MPFSRSRSHVAELNLTLTRIETNRAIIRYRCAQLRAHTREPLNWLRLGGLVWSASLRLRSSLHTLRTAVRWTRPPRLALVGLLAAGVHFLFRRNDDEAEKAPSRLDSAPNLLVDGTP